MIFFIYIYTYLHILLQHEHESFISHESHFIVRKSNISRG